MQQHPVPQNVTQYQFRLVGDMTLKQFLELAGGLIVAYLFFASNLIVIVKWPLALLSALFAFGLAFFPIEDRPLDVWIVNFIKSIYRPTRFIWKKSNKIPALFTFLSHATVKTEVATKTLKAPSAPIPVSPPPDDVSKEERVRLDALNTLFSRTPPGTPPTSSLSSPSLSFSKPSIAVRKLKPLSSLSSTPIYQKLAVPTTESIKIGSSPAPTPTPASPSPASTIFSAPSVKQTKIDSSFTAATKISLPAPPTSPNLVVGMVVNSLGKIVENAIVQIVNNESVPQRAIKTNSLGQFYTSTPLSAGTYLLEVEKDGLTFTPKKLIVENKVISPLLLQASS